MNFFEILGAPRRLVISGEELERCFDERGKRKHPDAGGSDEEFSSVREAYEHLKLPSGRIRAALETLGSEVDSRGAIPAEVMEHFSSVATVLEGVNDVLRERAESRSVLSRALIDAKIPVIKQGLEEILSEVLRLEDGLLESFSEFDEKGWRESALAMAEVARGLAFIEKWKSQLQGATGKLFEALLGGAS